MSLTTGTRIGPYEVVTPLGSGGMGEVYRARDTKLGRDVALKILPETLASDSDRLARFRREAQVLAALNHPNIAAIYGFEDSGSTHALVLELVEGPTLADRIAQGALSLDDALPIARQIADALEAAHEQGIVHRDLKAANIKVRSDGTVKVLDFGLAKLAETGAVAASGAGFALTQSPTITTPAMTMAGMILGTAAYMSPEQAKGRPADKRSDIWAFGCVLFEMLTGRRMFDGDDVSDTLAAVLRADPQWNKLPVQTPQAVRRVLARCLQKDRRQRLADIADARMELDAAAEPAPVAGAGMRRGWISIVGASVLVTAVVTIVSIWIVIRHRASPTPQAVRFGIGPTQIESLALFRAGADHDVAVSPDGSFIVYRAGGAQAGSGLVVRMVNQLDAQRLDGVVSIGAPFVSPDSRWIGYFVAGELRKIAVKGGAPVMVCRVTGVPRGASWGEDGNIVFATNDITTGLLVVPATGGVPKELTKSDPARLLDHMFPSVLPGGRGVLYTVRNVSAVGDSASDVAVLNVRTGESKTIVHGGGNAEYVATGHLIYATAGGLSAIPFDATRLEVAGDPIPLSERIEVKPSGAANFAISRTGVLVYVPGGGSRNVPRSLVWVDRQGHEEPLNVPQRPYMMARLSPDGRRVALQVDDPEGDLWIWDLNRLTLTRFTFDPALDNMPVWTPDGARIIFNSTRNGVQNIYSQAADGTGSVERLTTSPHPQFPFSISPDGTRLLLGEVSPGTGADVRQFLLKGGRDTEPLVQTAFGEYSPKISGNGRWMAYQSNDSGQFQIYVRPFPNVDSGRWQISTAGGTRPVWARNGRELFYLDGNNILNGVSVETDGSGFRAGTPKPILSQAYYNGFNLGAFDVSLDGQRFLMIKEPANPSQQSQVPSIAVAVNWVDEFRQQVER
jgi:serine/threonine-protein kinase